MIRLLLFVTFFIDYMTHLKCEMSEVVNVYKHVKCEKVKYETEFFDLPIEP